MVENLLTTAFYEELMLSKDEFTFLNPTTKEVELDGAAMMYLIFAKVDPDTIVGLDAVEDSLKAIKLSNFGNNVGKLLTAMEAKYKILKDNRRPPQNYSKILLEALISGQNADYNVFVKRIIDDRELGAGAITK